MGVYLLDNPLFSRITFKYFYFPYYFYEKFIICSLTLHS